MESVKTPCAHNWLFVKEVSRVPARKKAQHESLTSSFYKGRSFFGKERIYEKDYTRLLIDSVTALGLYEAGRKYACSECGKRKEVY